MQRPDEKASREIWEEYFQMKWREAMTSYWAERTDENLKWHAIEAREGTSPMRQGSINVETLLTEAEKRGI